MKKFWNIILKILKTIIAVPLGIVGSILISPFYLILFLIAFSTAIIEDIWKINL